MKRNKIFRTAAITAAAICITGGTVFAASNHFKAVQHTDYGLVTSDNSKTGADINSQKNNPIFSTKDTTDIRDVMSKLDDGWKVLKKEDGNNKTSWIQKITSEDQTPMFTSDDKVHWTKSEDKGTLAVEYVYNSYKSAQTDSNIPNILSKQALETLSIEKTASYFEYHSNHQEDITSKELLADFKYKNTGKIHLQLTSDLTCKDGENTSVGVITGIDKPTNQRSYTTKNGTEYKLSDNVNNGITSTTTLFVSGRNTLILKFTDMTDYQIHEVLDSINEGAFNQK